jgi:uncharacterized phiE125 gp8 family phage protein
MSLMMTAAPAVEPVTLAEAKAHCRADSTAEDPFISSLIVTSRLQIEAAMGLALITQSWRLTLDGWPPGGALQLPMRPVQSIESFDVTSPTGVTTAVPEAHWHLDSYDLPPRIVLTHLASPIPGGVPEGIGIDFTAGFGTQPASVPQPIRHALLLLVAHWFENREPAAIGASVSPIPDTVSALLAPWRTVRL